MRSFSTLSENPFTLNPYSHGDCLNLLDTNLYKNFSYLKERWRSMTKTQWIKRLRKLKGKKSGTSPKTTSTQGTMVVLFSSLFIHCDFTVTELHKRSLPIKVNSVKLISPVTGQFVLIRTHHLEVSETVVQFFFFHESISRKGWDEFSMMHHN